MSAWISLILIITSLPVFFFVKQKYQLKDDSVVEEFLEERIDKEFGVKVDLTPESPEEK